VRLRAPGIVTKGLTYPDTGRRRAAVYPSSNLTAGHVGIVPPADGVATGWS